MTALFDNFAKQYDVYNDLISLWTHHFVKAKCLELLTVSDNADILDICTGTGDIARKLKQKYPTAKITGIDISKKMLDIAKEKSSKDINYILSPAENLCFENESFDIVTSFFGIRNIPDKDSVIKEIKRVLKPDGCFLHVDFGKPDNFAQKVFNFNTKIAKRFFAKNVPSDYFLNSIENFFTPCEFIDYLEKHNFTFVKKQEFMFSVISAMLFVNN